MDTSAEELSTNICTVVIAALSHIFNGALLVLFAYKILKYDLKLKCLKSCCKKKKQSRSSSSATHFPSINATPMYYNQEDQKPSIIKDNRFIEHEQQQDVDDEDELDSDEPNHFLNLPTRFQIIYTLVIFIHTFHEYTAFYWPDTNSAIVTFSCYAQAIIVQGFTILTGMYTLAIAVWMYLWIVEGKTCKLLEKPYIYVLEVLTHVVCWFVTILFTVLPFYNNSYGPVSCNGSSSSSSNW